MAASTSDREAGENMPVGGNEADLMVRNGITRARADHYHVDGYRYTSLDDALAQVRRGAAGRAAGS